MPNKNFQPTDWRKQHYFEGVKKGQSTKQPKSNFVPDVSVLLFLSFWSITNQQEKGLRNEQPPSTPRSDNT